MGQPVIQFSFPHYTDVIMRSMVSQITIVCTSVCSGADQRGHQSSASLSLLREIHRSPVDSPHKGPVTRKIFPFDEVIMKSVNSSERQGSQHMNDIHEVFFKKAIDSSGWYKTFPAFFRIFTWYQCKHILCSMLHVYTRQHIKFTIKANSNLQFASWQSDLYPPQQDTRVSYRYTVVQAQVPQRLAGIVSTAVRVD